jgi:hypothetical protein
MGLKLQQEGQIRKNCSGGCFKFLGKIEALEKVVF